MAERRLSGARGPAGGAHQKHRLAGRDEALGAVRPEGGAGLVQLEGAEEIFAEIAVLTGRRLWLARHEAHVCTDPGYASGPIPQIATSLKQLRHSFPASCGNAGRRR